MTVPRVPDKDSESATFLDKPEVNRVLSLIGRAGIAFLFCSAAIYHLTLGRRPTVNDMNARGVPFPELLDPIAMAISAGLALALLFGFRSRWAAFGLATYTVVVSSVMYTPGVGLPTGDLILFMKDMALAGALLAWSCTLSMQRRTAAVGKNGSGSPISSGVVR